MAVQTMFLIIIAISAIFDMVVSGPMRADIIFPDDQSDKFVVKSPPVCGRKDPFCENVDLYPATELREKVPHLAAFEDYFAKSIVGMDEDELAQRKFASSDETIPCPTSRKTVFPRMAANVLNSWKYIFNHDNHRQGVQVELCTRRTSHSFYYPIVCEQSFLARKLLAVAKDGTPTWDVFNLPSGCVCKIKKSFAKGRN